MSECKKNCSNCALWFPENVLVSVAVCRHHRQFKYFNDLCDEYINKDPYPVDDAGGLSWCSSVG